MIRLPRRIVVIESPFRATQYFSEEQHVLYAELCLQHSLSLFEAPLAGHLLYTRVLDDDIPSERAAGIEAHIRCIDVCELVAVYGDFGISEGMRQAIDYASQIGKKIERRSLQETHCKVIMDIKLARSA
jgi:hypothetical protein